MSSMSILSVIFGKKSNIDQGIFIDNSKSNSDNDFKIIEGDDNSSLGWGVAYKSNNFITHSKLPIDQSSLVTFSSWQKVFFIVLMFLLLLGF